MDLIDDHFSKIFNIVLPMKTRFEQPIVNIIIESIDIDQRENLKK